jgi:hypothetical protein
LNLNDARKKIENGIVTITCPFLIKEINYFVELLLIERKSDILDISHFPKTFYIEFLKTFVKTLK